MQRVFDKLKNGFDVLICKPFLPKSKKLHYTSVDTRMFGAVPAASEAQDMQLKRVRILRWADARSREKVVLLDVGSLRLF